MTQLHHGDSLSRVHVRNLATDSEAKVNEKDPLFWLYQKFWHAVACLFVLKHFTEYL